MLLLNWNYYYKLYWKKDIFLNIKILVEIFDKISTKIRQLFRLSLPAGSSHTGEDTVRDAQMETATSLLSIVTR